MSAGMHSRMEETSVEQNLSACSSLDEFSSHSPIIVPTLRIALIFWLGTLVSMLHSPHALFRQQTEDEQLQNTKKQALDTILGTIV